MSEEEPIRQWSPAASARVLWGVAAKPRKGRGADDRARSLVSVTRRAAEQALRRQYGRSEGDVTECFALLQVVPGVLGLLLDQTAADESADGALDRELAKRLGGALAQTIHLNLHRAWQRGQTGDGEPPRPNALERMMRDAERTYRSQLMASRAACRQGRDQALQALLEEIFVDAFDGLARLTTQIAQLSSEVRQRDTLGLRVTRLARKSAMLCAALVLLRARLSSGRTRKTTADIARSRVKLTRDQPRLRATPTAVSPRASLGDEVRLRGRIEEVTWHARPEKPYTRLALAGGTTIHAHYKNLTRLGIQSPMHVWAHGKLEEVDGEQVVVAAFEGPGQHADDCWEDWIADEVRSAYELYPEVLFMEWEFPHAGARGISKDLRVRLGKRAAAGEG